MHTSTLSVKRAAALAWFEVSPADKSAALAHMAGKHDGASLADCVAVHEAIVEVFKDAAAAETYKV